MANFRRRVWAPAMAAFGLPTDQEIAVLLIFIIPRPSVVLTPVVVSLALGDRSRDLLDAPRGWMARNSLIVMAVLFLVIGAKLIGDAISGFA